ncbi:PREDICTED: uncharacterized protein LOC109210484 [Nicotiana attenuata]|uniref:uncharacterized protein LOC109210484 n=1 Tax=Nicotiana attenuata TaxID=49451 RepID=UPI0009050D9E|nr:PREDICTED: uncharacterized protein LOC109210484 [Nicotiana attenuata]
MKPTLADVVKGNRALQQGMKLDYYAPVMKEATKIVRLNRAEVAEQTQKWKETVIGYVLGENPSFKEMLKFVYEVWNFINAPQVFLHDDGYFIFRFNSDDDKNSLIQQGPYTFHNRLLILKQWEPNFQMNKELTRKIPIWVIFPGLPIQYWTQENLGRIASYLGKPICSDRLTAEGERISYARMLVEMDVSQELPDDMLIEEEKGQYRVQTLEYEWKPVFCEKCCQISTLEENCEKAVKKKASEWRAKTITEQVIEKKGQRNVQEENQPSKKQGMQKEQNMITTPGQQDKREPEQEMDMQTFKTARGK